MSTRGSIVSSITKEACDLIIRWSLKGAVLLHIEDDSQVRDLIKKWFSKFEMQVIPAKNGEEAISKALATPPRIILVDWHLDGALNGFAAVAEIQKKLGTEVTTIVNSGCINGYGDCKYEAQKYGLEFDYFVGKGDGYINEIIQAISASVSEKGHLRKKIEEIVSKEIWGLVPDIEEMETKAIHRGKVESLTDVESVIRFQSDKQAFRVSFPTWRLIRAKADDIGAEVEHHIMAIGTKMISDLRIISPVTYEEEELEELPEETLERIKKWEEDQRNERE